MITTNESCLLKRDFIASAHVSMRKLTCPILFANDQSSANQRTSVPHNLVSCLRWIL